MARKRKTTDPASRVRSDTISYRREDGTMPSLSDAYKAPASPAAAKRIGTILGSYRLIELIGEGGMGQVFLAEHTKLGRKVALKTLRSIYVGSPRAIHRFFTEARAVNQIQHENIVEITDFVEEPGGDNYYIMELLTGENLADVIRRGGALPLDRVLRLAIQVCSALQAVHDAGIVHRDLKADNIFIHQRGTRTDIVKLLDFGVAKLAETHSKESSMRTAVGAVLGTPEYMSPEQAAGRVDVDYRSDIYAFGVILYEMVTGTKPFKAKSFDEMLIKHMSVTPPLPSEVPDSTRPLPDELQAVVMSCLEKEPDARPENMRKVEERLCAIERQTEDRLASFFEKSDERVVNFQNTDRLQTSRIDAQRVRSVTPSLADNDRLSTESVPAFKIRGRGFLGLLKVLVLMLLVFGLSVLGGWFFRDRILNLAGLGQGQSTRQTDAVFLQFHSMPAGAEVYRQDSPEPLGMTPLLMSLARSDEPVDFTLRLKGYREVNQRVRLSEDQQVLVKLARESVSPATPPPEPETGSGPAAGTPFETSQEPAPVVQPAEKPVRHTARPRPRRRVNRRAVKKAPATVKKPDLRTTVNPFEQE